MPSKLEQAEALIRELTRDELVRLQKRIKINLDNGIYYQGTGVEQAQAGSDEHILLDAVIRGLSARGLEFPLVSILMNTQVYQSFRKKTPEVFQYLRQTKCSDVELLALITLGMDLLILDIKVRQGLPPSARQLMSQIHRIPQVINFSFPQYAEMGLLLMLVRQGQR